MIHSKINFIRPYSAGDETIFIQNQGLKTTFSIDPWRVTSTYHYKCYIVIKLQGTDNPSMIKFSTESEALEALTIFQGALDIAKSGSSDIPKEIITLINTEILNVINDSHFAHRQHIASDTWLVGAHTMNKKGAISITDDNFEIIWGKATYVDDANVRLEFNKAITGWCFLN